MITHKNVPLFLSIVGAHFSLFVVVVRLFVDFQLKFRFMLEILQQFYLRIHFAVSFFVLTKLFFCRQRFRCFVAIALWQFLCWRRNKSRNTHTQAVTPNHSEVEQKHEKKPTLSELSAKKWLLLSSLYCCIVKFSNEIVWVITRIMEKL